MSSRTGATKIARVLAAVVIVYTERITPAVAAGRRIVAVARATLRGVHFADPALWAGVIAAVCRDDAGVIAPASPGRHIPTVSRAAGVSRGLIAIPTHRAHIFAAISRCRAERIAPASSRCLIITGARAAVLHRWQLTIATLRTRVGTAISASGTSGITPAPIRCLGIAIAHATVLGGGGLGNSHTPCRRRRNSPHWRRT